MGFINTPVRWVRHPERTASHPDLRPGEQLIEMAGSGQVMKAVGNAVFALIKYYDDNSPVCVPILRAAECLASQLQVMTATAAWSFAPMHISTTDGQKRLPRPKVFSLPDAELLAGRRVLLADAVADTLQTLRLAADSLMSQAADRGVVPPSDIKAFALVLKQGAARRQVPELLSVAALADAADWVVGVSNGNQRGPDLDDRFAYGLPGLYHIQISGPHPS